MFSHHFYSKMWISEMKSRATQVSICLLYFWEDYTLSWYLKMNKTKRILLASILCIKNGSITNDDLETSATFAFPEQIAFFFFHSLPNLSLCCRAFEIGWGKINCEVLCHYCKMKSWRALWGLPAAVNEALLTSDNIAWNIMEQINVVSGPSCLINGMIQGLYA